ncbi:Gfo/Idh/MocA family oxidoreductase [Clostridium estertheticum]|uniref:Gfo/Idh/MocA family protein n=1 Tax=Clostridium estertheticum TaxID=238834 RepID=UPI001C7CF583|nr:Gfo/Idh/MocA family oxidoreductase [Clostridium estertheticum]MBX4260088.1 Gfo/Idh/MocA family oxidoreductase [Clostridium estertheticum]WLC72101.1 Gfo/Idh/MocA family oxidoreductase [Clostridium estertheticum]
MKILKVAIIGCGNIFPMHAQSIKEVENAEIVAVCDIKEDRAKEKADQYNCNYYIDYKDMLSKKDIDVVHICLPHFLHAQVAIYASKLGKHILTEKPMSIKLSDAEAMVKSAKENNVTLGVIFQNRYNPGSRLIKETLESGELGEILGGKLEVTWKRTDEYYGNSDWKGTWDMEGGGVIIDQAIHTMDLMRWFVGSDIDYIDANISNRAHKIIQVEDSAEGVIKYKNGVVTAFHAINYYTYDAPVKIEIHCEKGMVNMVGDRADIKFNDGRELIADNNPNDTFDYGNGAKGYWGTSHTKQIKNYYASISAGLQPDITGDDAIKTQKMICAIYESGRKRVRISCNK